VRASNALAEHPLAGAIVAGAQEGTWRCWPGGWTPRFTGKGVTGLVSGAKQVGVGNRSLLDALSSSWKPGWDKKPRPMRQRVRP